MTAIDWLLRELYNNDIPYYFSEVIQEAKEMEKQQIIDAFDCDGSPQPGEKWISNGIQYYNETYGSNKGV